MPNLVSNQDYTLLNTTCEETHPTTTTSTSSTVVCEPFTATEIPTDPTATERLNLFNSGLSQLGDDVPPITDIGDVSGTYSDSLGLGATIDPYSISSADHALWVYLLYQEFWWYVEENNITVYAVSSPYFVTGQSDASGGILFADTTQFDYNDFNSISGTTGGDLDSANGKVQAIASPHTKLAIDYVTSPPSNTSPTQDPKAIPTQNEPWLNVESGEINFREPEVCQTINIEFFDIVETPIEQAQNKIVGLYDDTP